MIKSMTGYGSCEAIKADRKYVVETESFRFRERHQGLKVVREITED